MYLLPRVVFNPDLFPVSFEFVTCRFFALPVWTQNFQFYTIYFIFFFLGWGLFNVNNKKIVYYSEMRI